MQYFFDYNIKDKSLINSGQDNSLRAYFHNQKYKMVDDLKENNNYEYITLTDDTKERFKEFYKNEFFEWIHSKLKSPIVVSEFEYKENSIRINNPNYDWEQFKCIMQEMDENTTDPLNLRNKKLPIEQFRRQVEYYGIQKEINNIIINLNDFEVFLKQDNTIKMYNELIDFYNKNFCKIKTREIGKDFGLNKNDVSSVLNYLISFLQKFRVNKYNSDYSEEEYKEGTILDLFMFRDYSIDIFSNHTYDEEYYNNHYYDNDLDQTEQDNISKNPDIQQDLKLICLSNYDINRLFGDNKTLNKIMDV